MTAIWHSWVPGVLSKPQLTEICRSGFVGGLEDYGAIDHSSLDLSITDEAYRLTRGTVKPFGANFLEVITGEGLAERIQPDGDRCFRLEPGISYLFRIRETIEGDGGGSIYGQSTAKSSIGRLDVLVRLIVDGMKHYEGFNPKAIKTGRASMFLEVTPITFPVMVRAGATMTQLRLFYGDPNDCEITGSEVAKTCFAGQGVDHHLTVDLSPVEILGAEGCGFRASVPSRLSEPIPLWKGASKPDPATCWEFVQPDADNRISITKGHFYILRSKERLTIPKGIAVYARAIDEEIGEMRIHYAGFAHPLFGLDREDDKVGTPLIFEVRGHDVDVSLRHEEILARLRFFRMSDDADVQLPEASPQRSGAIEGLGMVKSGIAMDDKQVYNNQNLKLSSFFADWSSAPRIASD